MRKTSKFVKGFLLLTLAGIVCKLIGALYRIPLTNILGSEGIGMYQMIFPVFAFVLTIANGGIPVIVARQIASHRAKGEHEKTREVSVANVRLMLKIGVIGSIGLLLLAKPIAILQGNENLMYLYFVSAFTLFVSCLCSAIRNIFVGFEKMQAPAFSQVFQQLFKLMFGLVLAYIWVQKSLFLGVFGAMLGVLFGEVICLLYLIFAYQTQKKRLFLLSSQKKHSSAFEKQILIASLPVALSLLILPLTTAIESLVVVRLLSFSGFFLSTATAMFGVWSGVIGSLINLPSVVALSISTAIVPSIGFELQNNKQQAFLNAKKSLVIVFLFSLFCAAGIFVLAPNILTLLYRNNLSFGAAGGGFQISVNMLRFSALHIVLLSMLQCTCSVLYSFQKNKEVVVNLTIGGAIKVVFLFAVLIPFVNIWGALIGSLLFFLVSFALNWRVIHKSIGKVFTARFVIFSALGFILSCFAGMLCIDLTQNSANAVQLLVAGFAITIVFCGIVFIMRKQIKKTSSIDFEAV